MEEGVEGRSEGLEFGVKDSVGSGGQGWDVIPFEIFVVVGDDRMLPYDGNEARVYARSLEFYSDFFGVED